SRELLNDKPHLIIGSFAAKTSGSLGCVSFLIVLIESHFSEFLLDVPKNQHSLHTVHAKDSSARAIEAASFCCQFTQFFTDQLQATKDIANSPTRPSTNLIFGDCLAAGIRPKHYDSGSGGGDPAILYLSSGNGINSASSFGGNIIRPCFQSSLACSMRSFRDETKFHQIKRLPRV